MKSPRQITLDGHNGTDYYCFSSHTQTTDRLSTPFDAEAINRQIQGPLESLYDTLLSIASEQDKRQLPQRFALGSS